MTSGIVAPSGITLGLASRWTRFLGQMIDASIAGLPMFVATSIAKFSGRPPVAILVIGAAWSFFYLFLADGLHDGQSFAKQLLGVRVVNSTTGAPCTFWQSFVRNIFTILGPLDWIWIFGERHQRIGDKIAGTIVVVAD